ncbi:MAG: hypothetical protein C5B50_04760 [Verrucomicrobia bacterium]|nr:MAG: hypothetical protein C5B50_04760 [Verrucomicrobiota bacterium]
MKKVALVFILAVILPSLVLAWLAVRSLRDQEFVLERQESLLYQGVADNLARDVQSALAEDLQQFRAKVTTLLGDQPPRTIARIFDERLRNEWPLAQVGFVVTLQGDVLSPSHPGRAEAQKFLMDNGRFLGNQESAEVYLDASSFANNSLFNKSQGPADNFRQNFASPANSPPAGAAAPSEKKESYAEYSKPQSRSYKDTLTRSVVPQNQGFNQQVETGNRAGSPAGMRERPAPQQQLLKSQSSLEAQQLEQPLSKLALTEGEFRQLIGEQTEGMLARFVDNKLSVLLWSRAPRDPSFVFGAQLDLTRLKEALTHLFKEDDGALRQEICVALLDDNARPVALSHPGFQANWKRPFVATEIGEALPHWEAAVYLLDPAKLARSAQSIRLTLGLLVGVLVLAIGVGSWLIVSDLNRQMVLARQKTDFVSNVSHELKTPLTSIRMFSELLAEGRIGDPEKQRSYLGIIAAETARLSRLINNVLDFTRSERGEKKYRFQTCDLAQLTREIAETCRPPLEASGFKFECEIPDLPCKVIGDRDALAQVLLNLLSNAEKYSVQNKEITVRLMARMWRQRAPNSGDWAEVSASAPGASEWEVQVLDRGSGVPAGCEEKIFEKFYRAHDSLSSGIQGSGLGLTLARQIAKAHLGDVTYAPREGGGSCFSLRLPRLPEPPATEIEKS